MTKNKNFFTPSRITGLLYFGLAATGVAAFLFSRQKLFIPGDAVTTAENFMSQPGLTRFGIASELALVAFQALAALWFFKIFRKVNLFSAVVLASFGLINSVIILMAAAFWLSSFMVSISNGFSLSSVDQANITMVLFGLHESTWVVGKLFFGLWLIPMGYLASLAKFPRALSWILIGGGISYVVSVFLNILAPSLSLAFVENLTIPATIGEFWIIGYLLIKRFPGKS